MLETCSHYFTMSSVNSE